MNALGGKPHTKLAVDFQQAVVFATSNPQQLEEIVGSRV
jgi:hypothetical protein